MSFILIYLNPALENLKVGLDTRQNWKYAIIVKQKDATFKFDISLQILKYPTVLN